MNATGLAHAPGGHAATGPLLRRLYAEYVRPYTGTLIAAVVCMGLLAAATGANAWLMEPVLDDVLIGSDPQMLIWIPAAVVGVALIKGVADYGRTILMNSVGNRVIRDVRKDMFAHLMRSDLAFYNTTSSGQLLSRFINDVARLEAASSKALTGIIKDSLTVACLVTVMFIQDWQLACIAFVVFPLAVLPIIRIGRRMRKVSSASQQETGLFTSLLSEVFQGAREVKSYGMQDYEIGRAGAAAQRLFALAMKAARTSALARPLMEILGGIMIAAVVVYGGSQVIAGQTTPGAFTSFITALLLAYQPMKALASLNAALQEGLAAAQRIFALLDIEADIKDRPGAVVLDPAGRRGLPITFEDVTFFYGPVADGSALKQISLDIPSGKTVALVGPSGGGKSTLLNLIPRFYDVDDGMVRVGGEDVRDLQVAGLRANIALVSQAVGLFDDTVAANIAYGKPGAGREEIIAAAEEAAADEFIRDLPQGYDTPVGENGVRLSGGQKQRISIARAVLKDAPILLLDEATSALDSESERKIQTALNRLTVGRTTVVIAHRLSTVRQADDIVVLDGGRIIESGTHDQLQARDGLYAKLCRMQFREPAGEERPNQNTPDDDSPGHPALSRQAGGGAV